MTERLENFFLLLDPEWRAGPADEVPPISAVLGVWPVADDGSVGRFTPNPGFEQRHPGAVADPLDAVLRGAATGSATAEQIQLVLRDALFDIAFNGDDRPLIVRAPDGVPCAVIATSAPQRERAPAPAYRRTDLDDVVTLLPDGVDVLFNPGGPVPFRLTGDFLRETVMMTDDDVAAARDDFLATVPAGAGTEVVPWVVGEPEATIEPTRGPER